MDRDTLRDVRAEIDRADVLLSEQRGTFEKLTQKYESKKAPPKAEAKPAPPPPPPPPAPGAPQAGPGGLPPAFPPLPACGP